MTPLELTLAAACAAELLVVLVLLWMNHRSRVDAIRSIDRLLLLGKSSTPGEAIAAYEKLARLERARHGVEELVAQRRARVRGADQPEAPGVASKEPEGRSWFGFRRRPKAPTAA
jgi:hypothetical protein